MNRLKNLAYAGIALVPASLPVTGTPVTLSEIQDRIQTVAQFLIVVSMVIAVIMIIYGGIRWMIVSDPAEAKKIVINGIIGAAIVLAVGVILQTVAGLVTRSFFS
jgi:membrane-associated HD superfamily phosphohydrolase